LLVMLMAGMGAVVQSFRQNQPRNLPTSE
jgi:hypothetical protein